MTRAEKIKRIRKYRPSLYMLLKRKLPNLVIAPDKATSEEIILYNQLIENEAKNDKNNKTFFKNFSF